MASPYLLAGGVGVLARTQLCAHDGDEGILITLLSCVLLVIGWSYYILLTTHHIFHIVVTRFVLVCLTANR